FVRNVGEFHTAIVAVESVEIFRGVLLERRDGGSVREDEVGAAVVGVVEGGDSAGHGFDEVFFGGRGRLEEEVQAALAGRDARGLVSSWMGGGEEGVEKNKRHNGRMRCI